MIKSMTAFACQTAEGEWGRAIWELRSVNHRYLDLSWRLPEGLRPLEFELRPAIKNYLQRGKLEINLQFHPGKVAKINAVVNQSLVKALLVCSQEIATLNGQDGQLRSYDLMRWPGVVDIESDPLADCKTELAESFNAALQQLVGVREVEGEALADLIRERLQDVHQHIAVLKQETPKLLQMQREKLLERFEKLKVEADPQRLEQELVLWAQKIDVAEELDRLQTHVNAVTDCLTEVEPMGRRLDFLMQELNREANTLAAKATQANIVQTSVELKVLIEQMREQVQNIE